jgi:LysR family glycine cleavage system transcriptional activator
VLGQGRTLPPLTALRAFEAAARSGSFTLAGAELGVTGQAISLQVRELEAHFGRTLFLRQGNRITLTEAGRAAYPRVEAAFAELSALGRDFSREPTRAPLVISALPSLAELWLVPRLARIGPAEMRIAEDPVAFPRDGADLRVTYGSAFYPDHRIVPLFRDQIAAVAGPTFPAGSLADLPDRAFIHTDWGALYGTGPDWGAYMARAGISRTPDSRAGLRVGYTLHAVLAAAEGAGVALAPARLVAGLIGQGRLKVAHPARIDLPWDYVFVHPFAYERRKALAAAVAMLTEDA